MTVFARRWRRALMQGTRPRAPKGEATMKRPVQVLPIALTVLLAIALGAGCGANRQALRPDRPAVEFRMPAVEAVDIRLREEKRGEVAPLQPPSVADESKGRWLTLFEMNVNPSGAAGIPPAPAESP